MTHNTIVDVARDIAAQMKRRTLSSEIEVTAALEAGAELVGTTQHVLKYAVGEMLISDPDEASNEALSALAIATAN